MALTKRYVRSDAAGGGDGTTDTNSGANGAFTWAEMIADLTGSLRVGYKYLVKGPDGAHTGAYSRTTSIDSPTDDGTATSPNIIEGFYQAEGDLTDAGRDSTGALITTNFPVVTYTTGRVNFIGSQYIIVRNICFDSATTSSGTLSFGVGSLLSTCKIINTGTSSGGCGVYMTTPANVMVRNCDVTTASSGGSFGIQLQSSSGQLLYNRIYCPNGAAILCRSTPIILGNTCFDSSIGIDVDSTSASPNIYNNTLVNNTGDGLRYTTGTTATMTAVGNHITGNGGWGINVGTSTCVKQFGYNRFRDNTSGAISNTTGDWILGTHVSNITSDPGGGSTAANDLLEYYDPTNKNFTLKTTAAAIAANVGYRNAIGAHGAGAFPAGGGVAIISRRSNTLTLR